MKAANSPSKSPSNIFDAFVKQMLSRIVVFVDFIVFYAEQDFVDVIDLTNIKPAPTHYIGKAGDERIVDLVFQCPLKNGNGNLMVVIIFEHQSGSLKKIPRQLHKYIIYQCDLGRRNERRQKNHVGTVLYRPADGEKASSRSLSHDSGFVAEGP